jgi:hypothetical protein
LRQLIEDDAAPKFWLMDNGGRADTFPRPSLFPWAERRGVKVLGGSDPLSLPDHVGRAGSFGFALDDWFGSEEPATAIKSRIEALETSPSTFGRLSSLSQMLRAQVGLRWQRRGTKTDGRRVALV